MRTKLLLFFLIANSMVANASQVDTLKINSTAMKKIIPNLVITPNSYSTSGKKFPVLYLLHGAGNTYKDWATRIPKIKDYADQYNIIIVCPDGKTSWYFDSPIDKEMQYETYITKELVSTIDKEYNTVAQKSGRAITGQSMGGHGSFYLAFKHQDIWGAAGSLSGGVDIRPFPNNWDISKRLGSYSQNPDIWEKNTIINMLYLLNATDLKLIFECGTGDFFYDANKRLHLAMIEKNIPHDYTERPGGHNWDYWTNAIKYQLIFFDTFFQQNK
ncbi:alpha/beta hydrolase [Flavobacterium gilvum]|uniref:XynC protein n=1 Tax=Flavobacterium gilvum TaxID=1492737 RepID=A0AAC9N643_9FLAO|nr:alpha/beta hydrolase family protein [Flavobacterium gilvum]AOW09987.1 XynC protein [Flavobacterium gilvum]KFC57807.1 putative esterase [Flavobacterium gilvum]